MIKSSVVAMLVLFMLLAACKHEESEWEVMQRHQRYHVICVDSNGKEYYNKVGLDVSRDGGNIAVYFDSAKQYGGYGYLKRDVVTGNCTATQFDIRETKG